MKEEGTPRSSVADSSLEASSVIATAKTMRAVSSRALTNEPLPPAKNMDMTAMRAGKRPLHGTRLLVITAISRSRGESIMRQPVTPTALQPKPMQVVRACFPQAWQPLKQRSRLKATRGRYPKSSRRVKSGKNMAMGGSITEITHAKTLYTPRSSGPYINSGTDADLQNPMSLS